MSAPEDDPTRIEGPDELPTQAQGPVDGGGIGGPPPPRPPLDGPPPGGGPDRRLWIVVALLAVVAVLLALLLLVDDDDDDDTTTGDTSTSSVSTSTSSTTLEAPGTSATPTTASPGTSAAPPATLDTDDCRAAGADPNAPGLAAETVYEAWTLGDESCADLLMTDAALAELFSRDGDGATDEFQGCTEVDEPDPHADCAFTYEGGSTHYLMTFSPTVGWQVFDIDQSAD